MSGYTKLFNSILASTIWREDDKTRIVWITMLAMANKDGVIEASVPGLADFARVSLSDCQDALRRLSAPDEWSRSKEHEGRRIEDIAGGWRLINHGKYRDALSAEQRREYNRIQQQRHRDKNKAVSKSSIIVSGVNDKSAESAHTAPAPTTDTTTEAKTTKNTPSSDARSKRPIFKGQRFVVHEWQLDDIGRMLGVHLDAFDVHAWFYTLDAEVVASGEVLPQRDSGAWLQARTLTEAKRRGLPLAGVSRPMTDEEKQAEAARMLKQIHADEEAMRG